MGLRAHSLHVGKARCALLPTKTSQFWIQCGGRSETLVRGSSQVASMSLVYSLSHLILVVTISSSVRLRLIALNQRASVSLSKWFNPAGESQVLVCWHLPSQVCCFLHFPGCLYCLLPTGRWWWAVRFFRGYAAHLKDSSLSTPIQPLFSRSSRCWVRPLITYCVLQICDY